MSTPRVNTVGWEQQKAKALADRRIEAMVVWHRENLLRLGVPNRPAEYAPTAIEMESRNA